MSQSASKKYKQLAVSGQSERQSHFDFIQARPSFSARPKLRMLQDLATGVKHLNSYMELLCVDRLDQVRKRVDLLEKRVSKVRITERYLVDRHRQGHVPRDTYDSQLQLLNYMRDNMAQLHYLVHGRSFKIAALDSETRQMQAQIEQLQPALGDALKVFYKHTQLDNARSECQRQIDVIRYTGALLATAEKMRDELEKAHADVYIGAYTVTQLKYQLGDYLSGAISQRARFKNVLAKTYNAELCVQIVGSELRLHVQRLRTYELQNYQCKALSIPDASACIATIEKIYRQDFLEYKNIVEAIGV